jgi:diguanylate cyclase (GGDEF)-like protein
VDAGEETSGVVVTTLRVLLRATSPEDVVAAMIDAVHDLGGTVVPATSHPANALPVDLSFGVGEPLVAVAPGLGGSRLQRILPMLAEDARVAVARTNRDAFLRATAMDDPLTGLSNRRVAMRALSRMGAGDLVVFMDVDHLEAVNDRLGHDAGDDLLRAFARTLRLVARAGDTAGRLGGEEFALLLPRTGMDGATALVERLRQLWSEVRSHPVTFSVGMAAVGAGGGRSALGHAERALYSAKHAGRDRVEVAG